MKQLLLCALHRIGNPAAASQVMDRAIALALDAGWPNHHIPKSVHKVSAELRNMERDGLIASPGDVRDDGKDRPAYQPRQPIDSGMECPEPPNETPKGHPIDHLERHQVIALFDTFQMAIEMRARHEAEMNEALRHVDVLRERQAKEADKMSGRIIARINAAGLDGTIG